MEGRPASKDRLARRVLAHVWTMGFVLWGLLLAVTALLPRIQTELGLSFSLRSLVLALPFLFLAISAIPGGYLADRRGIGWTVGLGGGIAVAGAGLRAVPGPPALLLGAAALFGVGLGLAIPNLPKLVSRWYPPGQQGLATGIYATGIIAGSVVGVYLTLPLADGLGSWRGALAVWAAGGGGVAALWALRVPREAPRTGLPLRGFWPILRRPSLWVLAFLFAAGNASYFFLVDAYPAFLTTRGLELGAAAGQLALLIAVGIPAIFVAPVLSDRVGLRRPFLWGSHLLLAALLLLLPFVPQSVLPAASVALGFGEMTIFALALLLPVDLFPEEEVGRASGIVLSLAYGGALLGPLGFGLVMDLTGSPALALQAFAALSLITAAAVFLLPETGGRRKPFSGPRP